jgi:hypothetical protein
MNLLNDIKIIVHRYVYRHRYSQVVHNYKEDYNVYDEKLYMIRFKLNDFLFNYRIFGTNHHTKYIYKCPRTNDEYLNTQTQLPKRYIFSSGKNSSKGYFE